MAIIMDLEVKGDAAMLAKLEQLGDQAPLAIERGLYRWASEVMLEAKREVPVDTGVLRASGFVQPPKVEGGDITVTLGFGGPAAPYALSVHENPRSGKTGGVSPSGRRYKHWARVGKWKYLEDPAKLLAATLDDVVTQEIDVLLSRLNRGL